MSDTPAYNDAPPEVLEEIKREYEATLVIPETKPSPQWMLMPVGLVGAGKTTVVKPLASRLGLIRISTDEVRKCLKERGYSYEGAREISHVLAKKYLKEGYSVAVDANTGSTIGMEVSKQMQEAFPDVHQLFIHINPPEEFIIQKLKDYRHTWLFKDAAHAVERFNFHKNNFTLPNISFVYTFDTSKNNLSEQIKEGAVALERTLHPV